VAALGQTHFCLGAYRGNQTVIQEDDGPLDHSIRREEAIRSQDSAHNPEYRAQPVRRYFGEFSSGAGTATPGALWAWR